MNPIPMVSVIMGIYNCQNTLVDAIDSIQKQTYSHWQFIMCDDGSTDSTYQIAQEYVKNNPQQFILLKNNTNMGLNYTLNRCLEKANGEYIARMDGDDICNYDRFQKQVDFLNMHPEFAIVSSAMQFFDHKGIWGSSHPLERPEPIDFIKRKPIAHAPCMVRKEAYLAVDGYTIAKKYLRVEDYHLWVKMYAKGYRAYNLQMPLYQMRDDRSAEGRRTFANRLNEFYAHVYAVRALHLPWMGYGYALVPLMKAMLPKPLYRLLRKRRCAGNLK